MRALIIKKSRFVLITLAVAMLFSSGLTAVADGEGAVPISGNVSTDVYINVEVDYVNKIAAAASEATVTAATEAVESAASALAASTGAVLASVGSPVTVSAEEPNTVAMLALPENYSMTGMTTMAALGADGTLTPVPTRLDADGKLIVLVSGNVTLVPLSVEANFTDINLGSQFVNVTNEINRAASMMIIQGRGAGRFDPSAQVTNQEAATMFLRAMGVPVEWATAMQTSQQQGLTAEGTVPGAAMTRVETAILIENALKKLGNDLQVTPAQADEILAAFTDVEDLTDSQKAAMAICVRLGIFGGAGGSLMNPNSTLQRSQVASLAVRLQNVFLGA